MIARGGFIAITFLQIVSDSWDLMIKTTKLV